MLVPGWLLNIQNDDVRAAFLDVWKRLPEYVRPALTIDTPAVHLVDEQSTAARTTIAIDRDTRRSEVVMTFRRDLLDDPPAVLRSLISHELAHCFLRHFDHKWSKSHKELSPEVAEYFEFHADFVARHLFNCDADFRARNEYLAEHPELDEVRNAA